MNSVYKSHLEMATVIKVENFFEQFHNAIITSFSTLQPKYQQTVQIHGPAWGDT